MSNYYDKDGNPIEMEEWSTLFNDRDYQILKQTYLENGTHVSTVWLGLSHGMGNNGPQIFETLVTHPDSKEEEMYRYATEEQAFNHHRTLTETGNTYLGNKSPSRWDQIRWELEEDNKEIT